MVQDREEGETTIFDYSVSDAGGTRGFAGGEMLDHFGQSRHGERGVLCVIWARWDTRMGRSPNIIKDGRICL